MEHKHPVIDRDTHFLIEGATRSVKNVSDTKTMLVQYDHKSERFTFEVDRKPDAHDLSQCNRVRVHYINIEKSRRTENKGVCTITDTLDVCPEDDNFVTCSWLVPREATQLVGSLHFVIEFACIEGNELVYSWNTARHTAVTIAEGIDGGEEVVNANIDILTQWENELKANQIVKMEQTTFSTEDNGENVWTATFGDGRTQELMVRNGSRGETGLIGSIETISGTRLNFFVGTQAEYDELTEDEKNGLFAIITDDNANATLTKFRESFSTQPEPVTAMGTAENYWGFYYMDVVQYTDETRSHISKIYPVGIVYWQGRDTLVYYGESERVTLLSSGKISYTKPDDVNFYSVRARFINAFGY